MMQFTETHWSKTFNRVKTTISLLNLKSQKVLFNNVVNWYPTSEQYLSQCFILNAKPIIMATLELKGDDNANGGVRMDWEHYF